MVSDNETFTKTFNQLLGFIIYLFTRRLAYSISVIFIIYLLFFTKIWLVALVYLSWIWAYDKDNLEKCGRRSNWIRNLNCWYYVKNYFPIVLKKTSDFQLNPNKNYLFCIFSNDEGFSKSSLALCTDFAGFKNLFPHHDTFVLTNPIYLCFPFYRDLLLSLGYISNSLVSLDYTLRHNKGSVVALSVGDVEKVQSLKPKQYKLKMRDYRREFKIAMSNGTSIVPVIPFSRRMLDKYEEKSFFGKILESISLFVGHNLIPRRSPVTVVGKIFFLFAQLLLKTHICNLIITNYNSKMRKYRYYVQHLNQRDLTYIHKWFVYIFKMLSVPQVKKNFPNLHFACA